MNQFFCHYCKENEATCFFRWIQLHKKPGEVRAFPLGGNGLTMDYGLRWVAACSGCARTTCWKWFDVEHKLRLFHDMTEISQLEYDRLEALEAVLNT